jgi:hypothetical protein
MATIVPAGEEAVRRAPQELVVPQPHRRHGGGQANRERDQAGVDDEVHDGRHQHWRNGCGKLQRVEVAAQGVPHQSGGLYRKDRSGHAVDHADGRLRHFHAECALHQDANAGDDHGHVCATEQQGREVDGIGH